MKQIDNLLQTEITRKQFVVSLLTAAVGLMGISTFLGLFTKSIKPTSSELPGYGKQNYGP